MRMLGMSRGRRLVAVLCAALILGTTLQAAPLVVSPAQAADTTQFNGGNIIDDSLFWDGSAMTEAQIQTFLNEKVSTCRSGYTCLKDFVETTHTIAATPMCTQYNGAANERASTIIWKIAQTCGISPKVLLVILQKEQSLVTDTWPTPGQYRSAMGAGCPDTAACDSDYYGFFNQVHYGAYLLKRYTQPPGTGPGTEYTTRYDLRYPVGQVSAVQYNQDATCGTNAFVIQNQATHALYIYTPYTPNQAALNAGYSASSDPCSSYGNRNFFNFYTDWFGSTRGFAVGGAFVNKYQSYGGAATLGYPNYPYTCGIAKGGCYQTFTNGWIVSSTATPPVVVPLNNRWAWGALGNENSYLGYPTADEACGLINGGCYQVFEGGWLVHSDATPIVSVPLSTRGLWWYYGNENGFLKYPKAEQVSGLSGGGSYQQFQGGYAVSSQAGGLRALWPEVFTLWSNWGRQAGILGYPTGDPSNYNGGTYTQSFQGGTVTVTNGTAVISQVNDPWFNARVTNPWLGEQTSSQICGQPGGGCYQTFQGGWLVSSPAGAFAIRNEAVTQWNNWGRWFGILGYPSGAATNPAGGTYTQAFQGGTITVTNGVAVVSSVTDPWFNTKLNSPWLGDQTSGQICGQPGGGCYQTFQGGWLVSSTAGAFALRNEAVAAWGNWGRWNGILGYPSGAATNPAGGTYTQAFQGGTITVTNGVAVVSSVTDPWFNTKLNSPWLGDQTSGQICGQPGGGCYQTFQGGWLVSSTAGAFALRNEAVAAWGNWGRWNGILGYPSGAATNPAGGTYTQAFQGGTVTVTNGAGVVSSVTDPWFNTKLNSPWLGDQTSGQTCGLPSGGCYQPFQNGWLVSSPAGAFAVRSEALTVWANWGRWLGILGYPSGAASNPAGGTYTQTFQGGTITVTNGSASLTSVTDPWFNAKLNSPWLGDQTSGQTCGLTGGGCYQTFQNGWLVSSPAGAFALRNEVKSLWVSRGRETGTMGYPTGAASNPAGGNYTQTFRGGTVTVTGGIATLN